tara:strand:+ start:292 stop:678 length:387 start_codon:yes stop_codon:yes gene_type:complete
MQKNINTRELKHLCNFLTHEMNYKVELVSDEDFAYDEDGGANVYDWVAATEELCMRTQCVLDNYFTHKDETLATAFETAIDYRYDDDCINEGISEHFFDYCKKHNILDFYFKQEDAHDYDGADACMRM